MIKTLLNKVESKILTKLFMRWIDKEYDLETLALTKGMIHQKETEIKYMIDQANKTYITGFKRYE
jgi:hypothetical protein